jgi:hypothetical protein
MATDRACHVDVPLQHLNLRTALSLLTSVIRRLIRFSQQALRDPSILKLATGFVVSNNRFTMSVLTSNPQFQAKALLIGWARTKSLLVWPIFFFSILSVAISLLVGELARNAALGVAVTARAARVLTVWQAK